MNIKLRFSIHFIIGLFTWMVGMGFVVMLIVDGILPRLGLYEGMAGYDSILLILFAVSIIVSSLIFSWYFSNPIWFIISWISRLSRGHYQEPAVSHKIYTKRDKLKRPYRLYSEIITNIHELSIHLRKSQQEREKLEQLKKDWIAGISHDLKTPLTYISGYSALLLSEEYSWSEEEKISFMQEILKKSKHMETLIQDFNLSLQLQETKSQIPLRLEEGNLVEFLKSLLADTWNDPDLQEYDLSFHCDEDSILFSFDRRLLYRAIQNLLINAVMHNPPGTAISVQLTYVQNQFIKITIEDNGVGMDRHTLENLFKKYYRGESAVSPTARYGMGLGMSIVKDLILAHGGHISVDSIVAKGTSFYITIPFGK
ncbi:hypothetical protein YSY43_06910 [Paenibacillus sp. YSY-4.3]